MALPNNFTVLDSGSAGGSTIRELALAANTAYLTPYYLVQRKENVSAQKDVICVSDTVFKRGAEARAFLSMPTTGKATITPGGIPAGVRVFVQSSSHNRKIPANSQVLLQIASDGAAVNADVAAAAPAPAPAPSPAPAPAPAPSPASRSRSRSPARSPAPAAADANPRPSKQAKTENNDDNDNTNDIADDGTNLGSKVLRLRLQREGARSCKALQASLIWNDIADLDLSCITPDGTTIYYGNKESECGGWLDVDMNVNADSASTEPVENIFWASAPSGKYIFRVTNFNCHCDPKRTVFIDKNRSVPFRLFLTKNGKTEVMDGSVKDKEVKICYEFELEGDGALGSYVVMPPSDVKTTFKDACQKHGVTYTQGAGYYALARLENISKDKAMLLQNIEKDTFTIGKDACRKQLEWPIDVKQIRKGPKDIPEGYRLFVQSTSHNRLIPPGTHFLMKVSVKEALEHRPAFNTQFQNETHTMGRAATTTNN